MERNSWEAALEPAAVKSMTTGETGREEPAREQPLGGAPRPAPVTRSSSAERDGDRAAYPQRQCAVLCGMSHVAAGTVSLIH